MKCVKLKKSVRKKQPEGRDKLEVQPEEDLNADKIGQTFSDFQRQRQSRSARFARSVKRPYYVKRMGFIGTRRKKI